MFQYTNTNKRYHTFDYHLKQTFGGKVGKISLNAGFSCPNIDATKGSGGCIYCSELGSGDFGGNIDDDLLTQYNQGQKLISDKWNPIGYIAYFQARTNTYAPLSVLQTVFEEVLTFPMVKGISIATRADCITEEIADYLFDLSKRTYLIIELGLQTTNDNTAKYINRCHDYNDFLNGFNMLRERNIQICVHLINGLPFETAHDMINSAKTVGKLGIHSLKIHMLQILRGTKICDVYERGDFPLLSLHEYVEIVSTQLSLIPKEVVIQRLTGDGDHKMLVAPLWCKNKKLVLNELDKTLVRKNIFQGSGL